MRNLNATELKRLHRQWRRRPLGRLAVLLDNVQTPFNLGSIMRTAASFRVEHIYIAGAGVVPTHPKAQKTSLGTERYVPWTHHERVETALDAVKDAGYRLIGIELADAAVPLHELTLSPAACLAFGHEDRGLSSLTLAACDAVAYVPQLGRVGSLNVSHAAAIALYELRRQSWA